MVNSGTTDVNNFEVSFQLDNGDIVYEQFNEFIPATGGWVSLNLSNLLTSQQLEHIH